MEARKLSNVEKLFRIEFYTKYKNINILDLIFENPLVSDIIVASSSYEILSSTIDPEPNDQWKFISYFRAKDSLDHTDVNSHFYKILVYKILDLAKEYIEGEVEIFEEVEQDWVTLVQSNSKPVVAGKFYIANSSLINQAPSSLLQIEIEASTAFGTGEHETTSGCLEMLSFITSPPVELLDVGTGSGILAIAAKKLWNESVISATEIDLEALEVAKVNAEINSVLINFYENYHLDQWGVKFDVIIANILAIPLIEMRDDFKKMLKPNGLLILSGFLQNQKQSLVESYNLKGFVPKKEITKKEWVILMLKNT